MTQAWMNDRPPVPWRGYAGAAPVQDFHHPSDAAAQVGLLPKAAPPLDAYPPAFFPPASQAKALPAPFPQQQLPLPQQPPPAQGAAQAAVPRMANRFSLPEYRARLVAIYAVHKQENLDKVDYLMQKYSGNEEFLFQTVCAKYFIDPEFALGPTPHMASVHAPVPVEALAPVPALGMQPQPAPVVQAAPAEAAPPAQAAPAPSHRVMEWDPATGSYVETTMELDGYPEEVANQLRLFWESSKGGTAPAQASAAEDGEEEEEYDPFSTGPEQAPKDPAEAMVQIDLLLLGERSGFFEEPGPTKPQGPAPTEKPGPAKPQAPAAMEVDAGAGAGTASPPAQPGAGSPPVAAGAEVAAVEEGSAAQCGAQQLEASTSADAVLDAESDGEEGLEASFDPYLLVDDGENGAAGDGDVDQAAEGRAELEEDLAAGLARALQAGGREGIDEGGVIVEGSAT